MIAESNLTNFKEKLKEFTTKEPYFWFFTPKQLDGKPFCGKFDDSSFQLTSNSHFVYVKQIKIIGTYRKTNYNKTRLDFTIGLSKIDKILISIFLVLFFIMCNVAIISSFPKDENGETNYFISIFCANFVYSFIFLGVVFQIYIPIKNVKKKFYKYFEINV